VNDDKAPAGAGDPAEGPRPPSAWRRLLWLTLPVGYWLVATRVPLAGIELPEGGGLSVSLFPTGLSPLVTGYVLVEIAAALVPAWRPLRRTQHGRGSLARAAFLVALLAALFGVWRMLPVLTQAGAFINSAFLAVVTTLGATALLWIVVQVSDSRSGGSALALLLGLSSVVALVRDGIASGGLSAGPKDLPQPLTSALLASLSVAATVVMLRSRMRHPLGDGVPTLRARHPPGASAPTPGEPEGQSAPVEEAPGDHGLFVRLPLGGLAPLWGIDVLVSSQMLLLMSDLWPASLDPFGASWPPVMALVAFGGVVLIEVAFSWPASAMVWRALFDARRTEKARGAPYEVGAPPVESPMKSSANEGDAGEENAGAAYAPPRDATLGMLPALVGEGDALWGNRIQSLLLRAVAPTMAYLVLVAWPLWPIVDRPFRASQAISSMAGVCLLVAAVIDLVAETRFRLAHRDAVSVTMRAHVGAADAAIAALGEAGVPAFARNVNVRVLLSFFGPFAPIEVLVPGSQLGAAAASGLRPPAAAAASGLRPPADAARERLAAILVAEPESEEPKVGESESAPSKAESWAGKKRVPRKRRKRPSEEERS